MNKTNKLKLFYLSIFLSNSTVDSMNQIKIDTSVEYKNLTKDYEEILRQLIQLKESSANLKTENDSLKEEIKKKDHLLGNQFETIQKQKMNINELIKENQIIKKELEETIDQFEGMNDKSLSESQEETQQLQKEETQQLQKEETQQLQKEETQQFQEDFKKSVKAISIISNSYASDIKNIKKEFKKILKKEDFGKNVKASIISNSYSSDIKNINEEFKKILKKEDFGKINK